MMKVALLSGILFSSLFACGTQKSGSVAPESSQIQSTVPAKICGKFKSPRLCQLNGCVWSYAKRLCVNPGKPTWPIGK